MGNTPILLGGDLIVAIDGHEISDPQDISAMMDKHQAGDTVSVTILRGKKQMTLKLILGEAQGHEYLATSPSGMSRPLIPAASFGPA